MELRTKGRMHCIHHIAAANACQQRLGHCAGTHQNAPSVPSSVSDCGQEATCACSNHQLNGLRCVGRAVDPNASASSLRAWETPCCERLVPATRLRAVSAWSRLLTAAPWALCLHCSAQHDTASNASHCCTCVGIDAPQAWHEPQPRPSGERPAAEQRSGLAPAAHGQPAGGQPAPGSPQQQTEVRA